MAWGAAATGTRAATGSTGQGLSLMQESISRAVAGPAPARRAQHGPRAGRLLAGHPRRRPRRLPPPRARARWTSPRPPSSPSCAFHLADRWRNPVMLFGDYYLAHTYQSVDDRAASTSARCPPNDWALDGSTGGTGGARLVSPLGDHQAARRRRLRPRPSTTTGCARRPGRDDRRHRAAWSRPASSTTPRSSSSPSARPASYVRYVVRSCAPTACRVGYVRPITLFPFPTDAVRAAADGARVVGVYENNQGQMIDDVRLAVLGRCTGRVHRRPQPRRLGLRHRARHHRPEIRRGSCGCASRRLRARWSDPMTEDLL